MERPFPGSEETDLWWACNQACVTPGLPWVPQCSSPVFQKDFVEEFECELEPLGTQASGPANISLTVTNMPPGKHFRVYGTSTRQGFSFMVRPPCLVCAFGQLDDTGREELGVEGLLHQPKPPPYSLRNQC